MKKHYKFKRVLSVLLALLFAVMLIVPTTLPVSAANKRFITEIRVEAGEDAVDTLEADGFSVTMVGLNISSDPASQVYLGYKMNTGSPITNVILSPDVGDSCTDKDGVSYQCVSHVDVNEGIGGGAGCLYATRDSNAGAGLVGIDVLRGSDGEEVLYPITNDGAQIVRTPEGAPADLESGGSGVVYLAQIRDGIVRPYISEIGVITDSDKWNAVYTAAERGYDYYVEGDIDGSNDTYTIIGFDRTADPEQAVTGITAVAASTVQALEDEKIVDAAAKQSGNTTAAAVTISGVEYVRISSKPIEAEEPFYIYRTKDKKGGNPISMLYAEKAEQEQNFLLGTWANDYFFSPGLTTAYTYSMNEDIYSTLWEDQTVLTKLPVQLVDTITTANGAVTPTVAETVAEQPTEAVQQEEVRQEVQEEVPQEEVQQEEVQQEVQEEPTEAPPTEAPTEAEKTVKTINLTILTPRDGLPATSANLTGMLGDPSAPYTERTERGDRVNKYQASVFGRGGIMALILGVVVLFAAISYYFFRKRRAAKNDPENANNSNKSKKQKKSKKTKKSKGSR
nr:hypothetical protein [uncultured Ruminococcus sp.]